MASVHGPMAGLRILEVGQELGAWCAKLLGDMGAEVTKVEPPEGDRTRTYPPFHKGEVDGDKSLFYWYYNTNKKSVTIDIGSTKGRELFSALVGKADVLVDALPADTLDNLGVGYGELSKPNPSLIMASITPFGQKGPYNEYAMTDMTGLAFGGPVWSTGYDDHSLPPIRGGGNQWAHTGGNWAAMAILMALLQRQQTGEGQFIDVNMHAAMNVMTEGGSYNWLVNQGTVQRQTGRHSSVTPTPQAQVKCQDGTYVNTGNMARSEEQWIQLAAWLQDEGVVEDIEPYLVPPTREEVTSGAPKARQHREFFANAVAKLAQNTNGYDLFQKAQSIGLQWGIIYSPEEMIEDAHFNARGFVVNVEHPEVGGTYRYPGAPYSFSDAKWSVRRRAPLLGEDTENVLVGELGLTKQELDALKQEGVV